MGIPYWIESLVFSFRDSIVSRVGNERTVYYHFLESVPTGWTSNNTGFTPFNENQRSFIKSAFDYFSTIIDLKFVETKTYDSFNTIVLGNNDQGGSGSAGYMTGAPGDEAWGMFISNVHPNATSLLNPQSSSWVPQIYIHELGHVLGLKHPFGNTLPVLSDAEDNFDLTVMTYGSRSPGIAAPQGIQLQPLDIAALQYLYGPSKTAANATTDNSYTLDASGRNFIWDGGGIDRLDASSADRRLVLDLEPLTQGYFGVSPGSLISNNGQVTINRGTAIEDISATRFDDIIFGNSLDNRFFPNGGIDSIDGRDGNDTVVLSIDSSESKLYREENALVIVSPDGSIVRLKNLETVRYKDGDRNASDLINSPSTVSVPFHSTLNAPSGVQIDKFTLTYNFNEAVSGLNTSDFSITNGEIQSISGSGKTYLVTVAPSAGVVGVMTLQLSAAAVTALSGVTNLTTPPQYFQIDTAPVRLSTDPASATVTNSTIMLKFDAALSVRSGEVVVRAASGAEVERLSLSDASRFTQKGDVLYLYLKAQISDGSILSVNIPTGSIFDLNGNSISYTITTSPSQTVKILGTDGADTKNLGPLSDVYDGLGGDDRIWGEEGDDTIYGGAGNDRLNGMQGDDKLFGGDGDDLLLGGTGDDYFDGGSGSDTVDYNASFGILSKDATITKTAEGYIVKTASEGTDTLKNVETIKFADKLITLDNTHTSATNNAPTFLDGRGQRSSSVIATPDIQEDSPPYDLGLTGLDVDGDTLSYSITSAPLNGTAVLGTNRVIYTPAKDYNGKDSFVVTATDGKGGTATLTANVSVAAVNDAPTFSTASQAVSATAGTAKTITLAASDVDGDALTYTVATPGKGTASISGSTLTYTPGSTATGSDNFVVTASDGKGGTATQTINATVAVATAANNSAPFFAETARSIIVTAGAPKTITLTANDLDGDALTYTVATPEKGAATVVGNTLTYTASSTKQGSESFAVTAADGKGGTAEQIIKVIYASSENKSNSWATLYENEIITISSNKYAMMHAFRENGDLDGVVSVNISLYDLDKTQIQTDIKFKLSSDIAGQSSLGIRILMLTNGQLLVAYDEARTLENGQVIEAIKGRFFDLQGNQVGREAIFTDGLPKGSSLSGSASLANGNFALAWRSSLSGDIHQSSLQVFDNTGSPLGPLTVVDANQGSSSTQVKIASMSDNRLVAIWDSIIGSADGKSDVYGQIFDQLGFTAGSKFKINVTTLGVQWVPRVVGLAGGGFVVAWRDSSIVNDVSTMGRVFDSFGNPVSDEIMLHAPLPGSQYLVSLAALTSGGFAAAWADNNKAEDDTSGHAVRARLFSADGIPAGPEFLVNQSTLGDQFLPKIISLGDDQLVISWRDRGEAIESVNSRIFDFGGANVLPRFPTATQIFSISEDTPKLISLSATDPDNDTLTYTISTAATRGTTSISGGTITYTPSKDYNGTDSFVVTASDGKGGTAIQTINMTVTPVNDAPFHLSNNNPPVQSNAVGTTQTVVEDTQAFLNLAPFQDVEGDKLSYSVSLAPTSGTAEIVTGAYSSGAPFYSVRYTPKANFNGTDKVIVTISDGNGGTAMQLINITVTPVNDAPVFAATSQALSATAGTAKTITVAATDVDGDALTYTVATPGKGTASISGSTLTYTPGSTATGSDSFVVTASDGKGGTATQTINATVAVAAAAKAFVVNTLPGWVGSVGGNGSISGSNGFEDITVLYGQIALDGSFNRGGDIVRVLGKADSYVIGRTSASSAYIEAGTTTKVTIPIGSTGLGIVYDDGVRKLSFSSGAYKIGSQTFSADPTKITSATDGTVLPTGANPATRAEVSLLAAGLSGGTATDLTITGKVRIVGTNGVDVIKVGSTGGDLTFDGSFNRGGDIIILNKAAGDYSAAKFSGSTIVISSGIEKLTIPMGSAGLTLRFTDGDRTLVSKNGVFNIGDQVISSATATALTPSSITLSADQGVTGNSAILDATGKVIFTDDATKTSNVILKNFGTDDVIRVTGATASQYNFAISALDPKDLEITYTDAVTSATNTIVLDDVIKADAFIADYATASTALGWNFMAFG